MAFFKPEAHNLPVSLASHWRKFIVSLGSQIFETKKANQYAKNNLFIRSEPFSILLEVKSVSQQSHEYQNQSGKGFLPASYHGKHHKPQAYCHKNDWCNRISPGFISSFSPGTFCGKQNGGTHQHQTYPIQKSNVFHQVFKCPPEAE